MEKDCLSIQRNNQAVAVIAVFEARAGGGGDRNDLTLANYTL